MNSRYHTIRHGFTLLELLVSITLLAVLMGLLFSVFNQASKAWLQAENRVETFQNVRAALDFMSKELSQALVTSNAQFIANTNSLAFIAPIGNSAVDGSDLVKIVYRLNYVQKGTDDGTGVGGNNGPPQKLLRRISTFASDPNNCWNYGLGQSCAGSSPWDFFGNVNWPETSDSTKTEVLADNIVSLGFTFTVTNDPSAFGSVESYWISTNTAGSVWINEILGGTPGIRFTSAQDQLYMTNHAPVGVQITIGAIDSRAAQRLSQIINGVGGANGWKLYASSFAGNSAYQNIISNSIQYFSTYVSIPDSHQ